MISTRIVIPAATLVLGAALGLGAGWKLYRPKPAPVETAAPAVRQKDQSLVLQRSPQASVKVVHMIPKGSKVEREIQLTVRPRLPVIPSTQTIDQKIHGFGDTTINPQGRLVHVDLSLVRMPDNSQRVVASSEDGDILGGVDIPLTGPMPSKPLKWSASALIGLDPRRGTRVYGAMVGYSSGPFVFSAGAIGETAFIGAGFRW